MILSVLITLLIAKLNKLKIRPVFHCPWLLPVVLLEFIHLLFQVAYLNGYYGFLQYAELLKSTYLYVLFLPILHYQLYKPALIGSCLVLVGTAMNKLVMSANGGLMPIYPTVSKWTGYFSNSPLEGFDQIHCLGDATTKLKFLSDYIDIGYSILSPGDLLVHSFTIIILYYTIKQLNQLTN